ncbi:hypothetical protein OG206_17385 [Streptomyces sp. NBC_01341]|nr:hypothetical protein OG206_17385 [Streptomyces sp. NBC_01341]
MARAPSPAAVLLSVHAVVPGTDGMVFDAVGADRTDTGTGDLVTAGEG